MSNTGPIEFSPTDFKLAFTKFDSYDDSFLMGVFDVGITIITNDPYGMVPRDSRVVILNNLVAHLLQLQEDAKAGKLPSVLTGASQSNVSLSMAVAPFGDSAFKFWLNTTSYGMLISAMLEVHSAAGFMVGGGLQQAGYRNAAGGFGPGFY
ncbi:MAG: DUF4054 domain-containing protein [Gammaproteobacteria bacterium]|nr:DUF4054 domain-containing protein [Gammaproteobacteria bacterium]MCP4832230.1 DUF4054 domain-containing protein [Gammaproteobacteria bacterium]